MRSRKVGNKVRALKYMKKGAALVLSGAMTLSMVSVSSAAPKKEAAKKEFDPNGTYHATMGLQTATQLWLTHIGYYDKEQNKDFGTEKANQLWAADASAESKEPLGTFEDVEITGNGTYTLKLENVDFSGETTISQLHIATDIPLNDTVKFTNVKAVIDGNEVVNFEEGWPEDEDPYLAGGMVILLFNHWRDALVQELAQNYNKAETADNGWDLLKGEAGESIEITFTVSGFAKDNPDAVEATPTPEPAKDDAASSSSADDSSDDSDSSSMAVPIACGVAAVVVIAVVVVVVVKKKK